jgi:ABC-type lipoprotein release transport system permease subunit
MMLTLAWRNIWRKRWRSLFTSGAVAVVVLLTTLNYGLVGAFENGMYTRLTEASGHLQVRVTGYRDLRAFSDLLIRDTEHVQEQIEARYPEAQVVTALETPGLLEGDGRSRGVLLMGAQQSPAIRERFIEDSLQEGTLPETGDLEGIALSSRLANALQVGIGGTVYLYAPGTEGYGAAAYTVTGLLDTPGVQMAFVSLAAAQEVAAPDAATRLEIHLPDLNQLGDDDALPAVRDDLASLLGDAYAVETWRQVNPSMAAYLELMGPSTTVSSAIFFILAGLLVLNTVYLSIIERIREFGVIMAVGASRNRVIGMVFAESVLLCTVGALVGVGAGLGVVASMAQGFSFPAPLAELYAEAGIPTVLYASIDPMHVFITTLFALATGIIAGLIPAFTAARLEPVEAMRFTA